VSEFLVLVGSFTRYRAASIVATVGIILAALYILIAYQRTMQGPLKAGLEAAKDLSAREVAVVAPLLGLVVVLGIYPKPLIDIIKPSVVATYQLAHRTDPAPLDAQPCLPFQNSNGAQAALSTLVYTGGQTATTSTGACR
jgi:NADH-quinone oxidoreductase subunit M